MDKEVRATATIPERISRISPSENTDTWPCWINLDVVEERCEGGGEGHRQAVGASGGP